MKQVLLKWLSTCHNPCATLL